MRKPRWLYTGLACLFGLAVAPGEGRADRPPAKEMFEALMKADRKWTLFSYGEPGHQVVVEARDVRRVGGADVARLRWTLSSVVGEQKDGSPKWSAPKDVGSKLSLPAQVAVSERGAYVFPKNAKDAAIAKALAKDPAWAEIFSALAMKKNPYVVMRQLKKGEAMCLGLFGKEGCSEHPEQCAAEICLHPEEGVVVLRGKKAPPGGPFAQDGWLETH